MDLFKKGYPNLAAFQDSSENFMLYRRFGYLQSRLLLDKQDDLRRLQEALDTYDKDNPLILTTRSLTEDEALPRKHLLHNIEQAITSYSMLIKFLIRQFEYSHIDSQLPCYSPEIDGVSSTERCGVHQRTQLFG